MGSNVTLQGQVGIDNARIAGTQKYCMSQVSILVDCVSYAPTEIVTIFQDDLDGMAAVEAAKLGLADARAKAAPAAAKRKNFDRGFKLAIEAAYGGSPAILGTFGIVTAQKKVPTASVKAAAVEKAETTRGLRHTMGKNQKAKITAATVGAGGAPVVNGSTPTK